MKLVIRKSKKWYETEGNIGIGEEGNTKDFYIRIDCENISDTLFVHLNKKEELWLLNYLTEKNKCK